MKKNTKKTVKRASAKANVKEFLEQASVKTAKPTGRVAALIKASKPQITTVLVSRSERKPTVSSVARALIVQGQTNEQVLEALHKLFSLDKSSKRWYPAWYRAECVRKGLLSREQAASTRH